MPQVDISSFVTLHYRLSGPQGDIINTFNDKPATLSLGTGQLSAAVEQLLLGLEEGTHTCFELPAGEAFGQRNPQMLRWVSKKLLAAHGDPLENYNTGDVVQFPAPGGQSTYAGTVREVQSDQVLFDFNHPLAGQPVQFELQLIGVI